MKALLLMPLMVPALYLFIFMHLFILWSIVTNRTMMAAPAFYWVQFGLAKNAARGGPICDGCRSTINILHDLKSPNFVFLLVISVQTD